MERMEDARSTPDVSIPNLRAVGGCRTVDGATVRTGLVYRSSALHRLDPAGADALAGLGIRIVYDLRTSVERTAEPDRLPPAIEYVAADVIGDARVGDPVRLIGMLRTPEAARIGLGNGRAAAMWTWHYRDFVRLGSARAAYGRLFSDLADGIGRPGSAALVHCTTGKDRTGWAVAALLTFLGVADEEVMDDYLLSNLHLRPFVERVLGEFAARGGDPELLRPIVTVRPAYLEAARDELRRTFGTIEAYVATGLGIDAARRRALREAFLERA